MAQEKTPHPKWHGPFPDSYEAPRLVVKNSLTDNLDPFIPADPAGKRVTWYTCGPTVYDSAHLGHARAYVTFDIVRRILSDYFKYDVTYVMNITDIDDKIILRARCNHLVAQYLEKNKDKADKVAQDIAAALEAAVAKQQAKLEDLKEQQKTAEKRLLSDLNDRVGAETVKTGNLIKQQKDFEAVRDASKGQADSAAKMIAVGGSVLGAALDKEHGSELDDHSIFKKHTERFEAEFMKNMRDLGVRDPDALTRVTEYVPKIIDFVLKIIANGYAYESNGSVYFDVVKFSAERDYAKLRPWCVGNLALVNDGEGSLAAAGSEKKNPQDFALWKLSKPGEPKWESPWGLGRPGWHIECSAMASDILGNNFDVHSGGEDLAFPHHDNEIAQSEAYSGEKQWVNHFWHAGHLNIAGNKMSKSLKNFMTIDEALESRSPRVIRIMFLMNQWHSGMNYAEDALDTAAAKEKQFKEFFLNVKTALRVNKGSSYTSQFWSEADHAYFKAFTAGQAAVHAALQTNFNYPNAMKVLSSLVTETNKYLNDAGCKTLLLNRVATYVDSILRVFGVAGDHDLGFASSDNENAGSEEVLGKFLDAFSTFRDAVRSAAQGKAPHSDLLKLCDSVRDDVMPELGVRLEDVAGKPSVWKLDDPAELIRQRDEKKAQAQAKARAKLQNKLDRLEADLKKWDSFKHPFKERFASDFSQWSEKGTPTHDAAGEPLTKKAVKKHAKAAGNHNKQHAKLQAMLEKDPAALDAIAANIEALTAQLAQL